jgi:YVTN family beta-propeller protein
MGIALAPDGALAYVTTGRNGKVAVLDVAARRVVALIDGVGARPWGIGITPDGKTLYVANGPSNDVAVIDTRERRVRKRIPAGRSPWGIALDGG